MRSVGLLSSFSLYLWRFIQVPDYSVLSFSFSEAKGVRQALRHLDTPFWTCGIWWSITHHNDWPMSSLSPWKKTCPCGRGKDESNHKKENKWDAYLRRRRRILFQNQELFLELTRSLSLMCIPLYTLLYNHSSLISQVNILICHYHKLPHFQLFSSS